MLRNDALTAVAVGVVCSKAAAVPVTFELPCSYFGQHGAHLGCAYVKHSEITPGAKL